MVTSIVMDAISNIVKCPFLNFESLSAVLASPHLIIRFAAVPFKPKSSSYGLGQPDTPSFSLFYHTAAHNCFFKHVELFQ